MDMFSIDLVQVLQYINTWHLIALQQLEGRSAPGGQVAEFLSCPRHRFHEPCSVSSPDDRDQALFLGHFLDNREDRQAAFPVLLLLDHPRGPVPDHSLAPLDDLLIDLDCLLADVQTSIAIWNSNPVQEIDGNRFTVRVLGGPYVNWDRDGMATRLRLRMETVYKLEPLLVEQ
jgi:hypothetical protein